MKKNLVIILFLAMVFNISFVCAEELRNIALGMPYEFSVPSNYITSTDTGDKVQLTDGEKKGSYWSIAPSVCWGWWKYKEVSITIDLGMEKDFEVIKIYTRDGRNAGVLTTKIDVLTSVDNKDFKKIATWQETLPDPRSMGIFDEYSYSGRAFTAIIPTKGARGKYVKLTLPISSAFVACDEIEILSEVPKLLEIKNKKQQNDGSYTYNKLFLRRSLPFGEKHRN